MSSISYPYTNPAIGSLHSTNHGRSNTTQRAKSGKTSGASWTSTATSRTVSRSPTAADSHYHHFNRASEHTSCFNGTTMHEPELSGVAILRNLGPVLDFPLGPDTSNLLSTLLYKEHMCMELGGLGSRGRHCKPFLYSI
jgi:hypothetical protein